MTTSTGVDVASALLAIRSGLWLMHPPAWTAFRQALAALPVPVLGPASVLGLDASAAQPPVPGYRKVGSVGIVSIRGVLVRHATPINEYLADRLGWTVLDHVLAGLERAGEDREVRSVLLAIDSPGGEGTGLEDAAAQIRELAERKPLAAHVSGIGASGAYWLAAACPWVSISPAGVVGSIGSRMSFWDDRKMLDRLGVVEHEFQSTQSPRKIVDPQTEIGRQQIQERLDSHADVFISDVARFRGTTPLRVMEDFGQGDVLIASEAFKVGMVDEVKSFRAALAAAQRGDLRPQGVGGGAERATVGPFVAAQPVVPLTCNLVSCVKGK